jgi:hypothetical protein
MNICIDAFENQFMPRIDILVNDLSDASFKVSDILDLINWIEYHHICMWEFEVGERSSLNKFQSIKQDLLDEYKSRIKTQVNEWFGNIKKQPVEIIKGPKRTLVTSNPEDMFNIMHTELEVAKEKLPSDYSKEVAITCLQVLQEVQRMSYDSLVKQWRQMDVEELCATVNDNMRMQEKCDEFGEKLISFYKIRGEVGYELEDDENYEREHERDILINIVDEDWRIHSFELQVTKENQLEVLDTIKITQLYVPVSNDV